MKKFIGDPDYRELQMMWAIFNKDNHMNLQTIRGSQALATQALEEQRQELWSNCRRRGYSCKRVAVIIEDSGILTAYPVDYVRN